jgi:hypothetical protein
MVFDVSSINCWRTLVSSAITSLPSIRSSLKGFIQYGVIVISNCATVFKSVLLGLPHNAFIMQSPDLA